MAEHPIQGLMRTALETLKQMVDVNTVVGDPVRTPDGQVVIPVSRVTFGFAAGGTEFGSGGQGRYGHQEGAADSEGGYGGADGFPFGGGSGAGVSVQPVGFLVVGRQGIRMLPVAGGKAMDRLLDVAPQILERLAGTRDRHSARDGEQSADEVADAVIGEALPEGRGKGRYDADEEAAEVVDELEELPRHRVARAGAGGDRAGREAGRADRLVRRVMRSVDDAGRGGGRRP